MAKFFVGQRVRVVGCPCPIYYSKVIGQEGVVNEIGSENEEGIRDLIGVTLRGDPEFCFSPDELEPILPEGAQPLGYSFEQMMSEFGVMEAVK